MSKPPWADDKFQQCSTADFLSAIHIARRGVIVSRRWEAAATVAKESDCEPHYQQMRRYFYGSEVERDYDDDEAPEMIHSDPAVQFCERVGREAVQRGLLAAMIARQLLEEFRSRFVSRDTLLDFYEACSEISLAAQTHLHFLARVNDDAKRQECIQQIDQKIDIPTLPLRVGVVRDAIGVENFHDKVGRSVCERVIALSVGCRYLQYIETGTHRSPTSGMREPIDRDTYDRLAVVIRGGGSDALVSLITALNIAQNLEYEDIRSKSEKAEAAIENSVGYLRNADDLVHKRFITGMRQVVQSLLQKRRRTGENIVAERFAQLYRITNPDFISWNLSRVDLEKFYRIITACREPTPEEPVAV